MMGDRWALSDHGSGHDGHPDSGTGRTYVSHRPIRQCRSGDSAANRDDGRRYGRFG